MSPSATLSPSLPLLLHDPDAASYLSGRSPEICGRISKSGQTMTDQAAILRVCPGAARWNANTSQSQRSRPSSAAWICRRAGGRRAEYHSNSGAVRSVRRITAPRTCGTCSLRMSGRNLKIWRGPASDQRSCPNAHETKRDTSEVLEDAFFRRSLCGIMIPNATDFSRRGFGLQAFTHVVNFYDAGDSELDSDYLVKLGKLLSNPLHHCIVVSL